MSVEEYQQAFADQLNSSALGVALRRPGRTSALSGDPLDDYDLTARERSRLRAVSRHRGMMVNCMLYRASRLVGITRRLPMTVDILGPALRQVFDAYLAAQPDAEPEFDREALRFAGFVAALPSIDITVRTVVDAEVAALTTRPPA